MRAHVRFLLLVVVPAMLLAGCRCEGEPAEVPLPPDIGALDPQLASAVRLAAARIEGDDGNAAHWAALARLYQGNGLAELAVRCHARSVALDPTDAEAWYLFALAEAHLGHTLDARAHMQRSVNLDPSYGASYWRLGQWFLNDGHFDQAQRWYTRGTQAEPELVNNWVGLIRVALVREKARSAVDLLRAHVLGGPNDGYGRQLLAAAYRQLGRDAEAREEAARGRGARPALADPRSGSLFGEKRGRSTDLTKSNRLLARGRVTEAIQILESLRADHPADAAVLTNLGGAYVRAGRPQRALELADAAIAVHPDSYRPHLVRALALEAQATGPTGLTPAIDAVERALERNPGALDAVTVAGRLYAKKGDAGKSLEAYLRATQLDPENVPLLNDVAALQREQALPADAAETYERILRLDPANRMARIGWAAIRMEQGEFQGAEDLLTKALALQLRIAGERHADTRAILLRLAEVHDAQGETEEAEAARDRIR